ncbi:MAG: NAD-dependent protein deacylase, partial [Thermoplasmata archaeon]
ELLLSIYYASTCKMMIIVGTSLLVYPAASLPYYAKKNNSKIVYINKEIGEYVGDFDYIQEDSDKIIPMAVKHIKEKIEY